MCNHHNFCAICGMSTIYENCAVSKQADYGIMADSGNWVSMYFTQKLIIFIMEGKLI